MTDSPLSPPTLANERARRRESFLHGYIPPRDPVVDPSVVFHRETDPVDAVSFEVIRSKLWNLNLDHGDTIRRISGSHIVVEGYDFNCAIASEIGDAVTLCPYSMFFAGFADEVIKWTLEHRSMNVGIRDGDVFLQDDPWIGSNHAMDTAVFGPVFVEGKLFAWLFNCVHQRELGGTRPGGFIQEARDCHSEPTFMPPIKLVENDVIREDVADAWTRRSRLPELMALELKSQVAGFRMARERLLALVARYGARAIKGTMNKMVDDTARVVGARLASLPDAVWRDERYVSGANPGDRRLFKLVLVFEKRGDRLRVSNVGTDPATGSFNVTPGVFRAAVLNGLLPVLAFDQMLCAAGVLRQVDFEFARGSITAASHPSAVGTSMSSVATVGHAHGLGSKMVSGHEELARHAFASSAMHTMSTTAPSWRDARGNLVGDAILDMLAGGTGAFAHRDGIDFGGCTFAVANRMSDVEKAEQHIPLLYLFRRELAASGGHGRFRGGVTYSCAWVGHGEGSESAAMHATGFAKSVTMGQGIAGGFPGTGGYHWHATDTGIQRELAEGRVPGSPEALRALAPHGEYLGLRQDNRLSRDDLFELLPNPGAGWGDTLEREATLVAADVAAERLSFAQAESLYGVVLKPDGGPDLAATAARREALRRERLEQARPPRAPLAGVSSKASAVARALEGVAIHGGAGERSLACAGCGQRLGAGSAGYRRGCCELELPLGEIGSEFLSPADEIGEALCLRRYLCPGCGSVLDAEVCRPQDEPSLDLQLLD
ncbi:MAG: hydantoinase B/oxoprolinase family protein [Deltaproteobacteria bacterium]|nr:hydantoinase B/oxoprolinase family protein [Deltaproteobacteria bacterium]